MVDMIEQIQGAGLSGIAGSTGKGAKGSLNAKNSLFGKLLVMLEQHGKGAGKGHALLTGKDGKQATLSNKGESLIVAKGKHLLALATKDKHYVKPENGDQVTTLLAGHALIDATIQSKKADHSGKATVALQTAHVKGKQSVMAAQVVMQTAAFDVSGTNGTSDKIAQALLAEANKTAPKSKTNLFSSAKTHDIDQAMSAAQKHIQGLAHQARDRAAVKLPATEATQSMAGKENAAIGQQLTATESGQKMAATQLIDERIANAAGQKSQTAADKTDMRANAELASASAAAHLQQNKVAQLQHQSTTASPTAGIAISGTPDASLTGTGSQTSDKGNQDGRFIAALSGDAKAANAPAASSASFHQYLSGKATPTMTVFDSMNHIAQSASKGKTRLEIQLDPANLGKIQISLQSDAAKHLQVHIIADQSGTRQLIDQQLPQLKSALAQQGFDLSGFSMDSRGQNASSGGNNSQGKRTTPPTGETAAETVNLIASPTRSTSGSGLSIRI